MVHGARAGYSTAAAPAAAVCRVSPGQGAVQARQPAGKAADTRSAPDSLVLHSVEIIAYRGILEINDSFFKRKLAGLAEFA